MSETERMRETETDEEREILGPDRGKRVRLRGKEQEYKKGIEIEKDRKTWRKESLK